ncbi:MAG: glycoside hydrolase family 127 protein [Gemmatimonadetes bacterium]|nr:glycoside hydrolase family 127 protein [Gemmatimonadota bacterium]
MNKSMPRREFLTVAPAMAGALAQAARGGTLVANRRVDAARTDVTAHVPADGYPIRPKRFSEVTLKDAFWKPKITTNAEVTLPFEFQKSTETRRPLSNNVLEAAIYSLETHPDARLQRLVEAAIQAKKEAWRPDGGNGSFEVAVAWYTATGKRDLLDQATKTADWLDQDFKANNPPFTGGERDAINCLQLYRVTQDRKHLDLAKHYLDIRGLPNSLNRSRHNQSYKPVTEQSEAVGHAVNCATLMVSLVDVGVLTGIQDYFAAGQRMWLDAAARKMYITGGVGSTGNEGFGEPYCLPNISAYSETCAVLMFMTLNHRLFLATGDSKYIDVMERGMYNNAIDGVSASGDHYFYVNRLASAGDGRDHRWQRASLECCPPNLIRFLASMPGFIYAQDRNDAIYVNLYVSSEASFKMDQAEISLSVESDMPWGGRSAIAVSSKQEVPGTIKLRIPGWARNRPVPSDLYSYADQPGGPVGIAVNGRPVSAVPDEFGYVWLDRRWKTGDTVEITFPLEVRRVVAHQNVRENRRRMAIERGPIVFCAEWPDVEAGRALDLLVDEGAGLAASFDREFYGGVAVVNARARGIRTPTAAPKPVRLIPYYLWANRGIGEMSVWLSRQGYAVGDIGPAGGLIFYENPDAVADGWRYLEAAPFDQSAGARWGCFRTEIAGARGTAVGTGRQNTQDILAACSEPCTAAALCANLSVNGVRGWFLPSRDELIQMYRSLKAGGAADFRECGLSDNYTYWASSQLTADMAAHIDFADNSRPHFDDKDFPRRARAIRAF